MRHGWSQRRLADATDGATTERSIRNWENGVSVPYPGRAIFAVAAVLRTTPGYLLFGDEES